MKCLNEICGNNYEGDCLKKIEDDCKDFIPEPEPSGVVPVDSPSAGSVELPDNTEELLWALLGEYRGREMANADAFRLLPKIIKVLKQLKAIP